MLRCALKLTPAMHLLAHPVSRENKETRFTLQAIRALALQWLGPSTLLVDPTPSKRVRHMKAGEAVFSPPG